MDFFFFLIFLKKPAFFDSVILKQIKSLILGMHSGGITDDWKCSLIRVEGQYLLQTCWWLLKRPMRNNQILLQKIYREVFLGDTDGCFFFLQETFVLKDDSTSMDGMSPIWEWTDVYLFIPLLWCTSIGAVGCMFTPCMSTCWSKQSLDFFDENVRYSTVQ